MGLPPDEVGFRPFTGPASLKPERIVTKDHAHQRFRPFTGPASLKPGGRLDARGRRREFPALHRAGLIEASRRGRHATARPRRFPALHRAGLIEASGTTSPDSELRTTSFRPFTGPASLKRRKTIEEMIVQVRFRPFTGPASLKRGVAGDRGHPAIGFRPFTGPASLKHAWIRDGTASRSCFRPFTGPASLKRPAGDDVREAGRVFPALHRAGLIEAGGCQAERKKPPGGFRPFTGPASLKRRLVRRPPPPDEVSGPSQGRPH